MEWKSVRLRSLSIPLRLAITCLLALIAGGYLAAVIHLYQHYEKKDERPGLSLDDIVGSFHGVFQDAPLIGAITGSMRKYLPETKESDILMKWLQSGRISEDYDSLDLGEDAPAEILSRRCLNCHSRNAQEGGGIGQKYPLEYWDDVKGLAFSKRLDPVPVEILIQSTHTHGLAMPLFALAVSLLFLATSWPRTLRHILVLITFAALLADLACWWLARLSAPFSYAILGAGGVFGAALGLQILGVFIDLWLRFKPSQGRPASGKS